MEAKIYMPHAPSHGKARKWVRNRNVWVVVFDPTLVTKGKQFTIRSKAIVRAINVATEVDSRYTGPKSKYGMALAEAQEILKTIQKEIEVK